jgi:hypothetical protein
MSDRAALAAVSLSRVGAAGRLGPAGQDWLARVIAAG